MRAEPLRGRLGQGGSKGPSGQEETVGSKGWRNL